MPSTENLNSCAPIADGIVSTKALLGRYLAGFDDTNHTRQAPGLPNHLAWNLGHLALTMMRVRERITGEGLPPEWFEEGTGAARPGSRFAVESVAFGSKPVADASMYPPLKRCVEIFEGACDRLGETFRRLPESRLAETVAWGVGQTTIGAIGPRMIFHNGCHCGQIADLRRALGMGLVIK